MLEPTSILLGIGTEGLKFGLSREEVKEKLGSPSSTILYDYFNDGCAVDELWSYNDISLELTFDKDDNFKLRSLKTSSSSYTLNGISLINMEIKDARNLGMSMNLGTPSEEELTDDICVIYFDDVSISLYFMNGLLSDIEWGYLWTDPDTPNWPE